MRIAIVNHSRCKPHKCTHECQRFCPVFRSDGEIFVFPKDIKRPPHLVEDLCTGCAICTKKCPYKAIKIINTPEKLDSELVHRYGVNGFALFRLPVLQKNCITGLVGKNGTGKSTALKILSGEMPPNFGSTEKNIEWDEIIEYFKGTESHFFFKKMADKELKCVRKPQYVDTIAQSNIASSSVKEVFAKLDEKGINNEIKHSLNMEKFWDREIKFLSGGELQKLAVGVALIREADIYLIDEPSSFLDVSERLNMAKAIRQLKEEHNKTVIVVEHDLAALDHLSDFVCIHYGEAGGFGIVTKPHGVREGINIFLDGFIPEENVRFRTESIVISKTSIRDQSKSFTKILNYSKLEKCFDGFTLKVDSGDIYENQIIGILGPNGIGKTTFVKMVAGLEEPTKGTVELDEELKISYKPQYLSPDTDDTVWEFLLKANRGVVTSSFFKSEILKPFGLESLYDQSLKSISGGELQKVAIAATLAKEADLYLFDEPSAYLSVDDRLLTAKIIHRHIINRQKAAFIVEHDLIFQDYVANTLQVYAGTPGEIGFAGPPTTLSAGMNAFLNSLNITFRRDKHSGRPRVNKFNSKLDKEQKASGNYFYVSK